MAEEAPGLMPETTARFAASWQAVAPLGKVGLAVSGGPDSLALLLLLHEVAPRNFHVVTVDHGLRPESADEAAMVAGLCNQRGIPHATLPLSLAKGSAVQERARHARYAAMAEWALESGLVALVTAHHADDQAETMLMRLNRGAGLRGLAGMRSVAPLPYSPDTSLTLLRPLLTWRRSDLARIVEQAGICAADDPSNHDHAYERVRIRAVMTSTNSLDAKAFTTSASYLADADAALEWATDVIWKDVAQGKKGFTWNASPDLPYTLALRVLERILAAFGVAFPRGPELARWLEILRAGGVSTLGGIKGDARAGPWRFTRAPERRTVLRDRSPKNG